MYAFSIPFSTVKIDTEQQIKKNTSNEQIYIFTFKIVNVPRQNDESSSGKESTVKEFLSNTHSDTLKTP